MALNRKMVLSFAGLALATMLLLIAIVPSASRGAPASGRETLYVDSYSATGIPPAVSTAGTLTAGTHYTVTVRGSYSAWFEWPRSYDCGKPRIAPAYPTPGRPVSTVYVPRVTSCLSPVGVTSNRRTLSCTLSAVVNASNVTVG